MATTQTQAAARGISYRYGYYAKSKYYNWHKKQGSGVFSFLWEAFMLRCNSARALDQCWHASTTVDLYFRLDSSEVFQLQFNLSSKCSNSMVNITGKRSDPVRKIINIALKRASTVI